MEGLGSVVFFIIMGVVYVLGQVLENRNKRKPDWQQPAPGPVPRSGPMEPEDLPQPEPQVYEVETVRHVPSSVTVSVTPRVVPRPARTREVQRSMPAKPAPAAARHWLAGPDNLRRAMVIMTVLGPPVSQQPPDERFG